VTRQDALNELNLPEKAGDEDIEQAYRRLVRRYPPEFNPERFQKIDEAYRFLTSLPDMIEQLLSPSTGGGISASDFRFSTVLPPEAANEALASLLRGTRVAVLWPTGRPDVGK
jgi:hypothetical protein